MKTSKLYHQVLLGKKLRDKTEIPQKKKKENVVNAHNLCIV